VEGISVLCVCSFNRTRSVMMEALLRQHLSDTGVAGSISSAGTQASGGLATSDTVRLLAARGLDVRGHSGRPLDELSVGSADLVITAERQHVVEIAGRWPQSFAKAFTLPELVELAQRRGGRLGAPIDDWLEILGDGRQQGFDYLDDATVGEIDDPTGHDHRVWTSTFSQIDDLARRLAVALS
jgi:protein-tyrosine-phosphatase